MKKLLFLSFALSLFANFAATAEEGEEGGIGLSAGVEFGVGNVTKADDGDREPYIKPIIAYETSFLDGALDFSAELDYTLGFTKVPNDDSVEVNPQSLYFDLALSYNIGIGDASTLSLIVEHELDELVLSPRSKESNNITGVFTPAVKFNRNVNFGDIYAQIGAPITYIQNEKDAGTDAEIAIVLGWESTFDLSAEVETDIPVTQKVKEAGITVTPEIDYNLGSFTVYVNCEFAGIGVDGGNVGITPALGVMYNF
ncbi:hypothetical protein R80B4_03271 [Fibrobacteres bacterium R8-0-B4]